MQSIGPKHSDFRGYPDTITERTQVKTKSFQRNNCTSGQNGSLVTFSKTYTVVGTTQDLNNMIEADSALFNSQGQAYANSNGTCSVSCAITTRSIANYWTPRYMNGTTIYPYVGVAGFNPPYTDTENKAEIHREFINFTNNFTMMAHPHISPNMSIIYGIRVTSQENSEMWVNYSTGTGNGPCSTGSLYCPLPNKTVTAIPVVYIATSGYKSGALSISRVNGFILHVYFTDSVTLQQTFLGFINPKTENYSFILDNNLPYYGSNEKYPIRMGADATGRVYIAINSFRKSDGGSTNLGIWYSDFPRATGTHVFQNIYPWNYSSANVILHGVAGRTDGQGALLVYSEVSDQRIYRSFGLLSGGVGNVSEIFKVSKSTLPYGEVLGNNVDHKTYLLRARGLPIYAFNWNTGSWGLV